jgi:hypothetical protein
LTDIYVDGDACPVREEIYRVAARLGLNVFVVSNGSRPIRPPGTANVRMVLVDESPDAADDWIAERISALDVCVTSDIPLASRCLKKTRARRLPYWQTLDASEHRQCAGWSRDSPASAGVGDEYRRARSVDQEGPLSISQRARYGLAGCNARSGPQLSGTPGPVLVAVHIDRIGWPTLREQPPSAFPAPGLTLTRRTSPRLLVPA